MAVAITGCPGAGKSTVLAILADLGRTTVQADLVAREIASEPEIRARIAAITGLGPDATITERRTRMWGDPAVRAAVNAVIHPLVAEALLVHPAEFHEIPLLVENGRTLDYEASWCVLCNEEERLRRLTERYGDPAVALAVTRSQLPETVKRAFCDREVRTDGEPGHVRTVIEQLLRERSPEA